MALHAENKTGWGDHARAVRQFVFLQELNRCSMSVMFLQIGDVNALEIIQR